MEDDGTETINYERFGRKFEIKLWESRKAINEKKKFIKPTRITFRTLSHISSFNHGVFSGIHLLIEIFKQKLADECHEPDLERECINNVIPMQRLYQELNIWNLAIIDNIDFKQKVFSFGIYIIPLETLHMLPEEWRMVINSGNLKAETVKRFKQC
ncbi:hypothetical protein RhiirA4_462938 [Rhizophagus irregularis]|uniref:Uncharacterized protein n=1 Tax=Rhizophagus irregularis TaxID=588596 RepID=A0A2I1GLX8_9GLOM|nr:hypothetical protein RhiirA4_462938 [Rhizophagus irregularis]